MGQILWRTLIEFTSGTMHGAASVLSDCDAANMGFACVICVTILDPAPSQLATSSPAASSSAGEAGSQEARQPAETAGEEAEAGSGAPAAEDNTKGGDDDDDDDESVDETPLEQRQWKNVEEYRAAVIKGVIYRLKRSTQYGQEIAGLRTYIRGTRLVCVMWGGQDLESWNALKGRVFLFLVGPASVHVTKTHEVASKAQCRSLGHLSLEEELLKFCHHVVEREWGMELLDEKPPTLVLGGGGGGGDKVSPVDITTVYSPVPPYDRRAYYFPDAIFLPWWSGGHHRGSDVSSEAMDPPGSHDEEED